MGSRNERPMTRYFPELVDAAPQQLPPTHRGRRRDRRARRDRPRLRRAAAADPSGRVARAACLAAETPASFIAFDLLAIDDEDLHRASVQRAPRAPVRGARLGHPAGPRDARDELDRTKPRDWFKRFEGAGLDGVVAKPVEQHLPARQARDVQGEAPSNRRLRGRRLPHPQGRQRRRLAAARPVRRRRHAPPRRRVRVVRREVPHRARADARAAAQERARRITRGRTGPRVGARERPHARCGQPVERAEGPVMGAGADRAGRSRSSSTNCSRVGSAASRAVHPLARRPHPRVVHVRATRRRRPPRGRRGLRRRAAESLSRPSCGSGSHAGARPASSGTRAATGRP